MANRPVRRHFSDAEINMGIGMLEAFTMAGCKCPWGISEHCFPNVESIPQRLEVSRIGTPEVGNVQRPKPRTD